MVLLPLSFPNTKAFFMNKLIPIILSFKLLLRNIVVCKCCFLLVLTVYSTAHAQTVTLKDVLLGLTSTGGNAGGGTFFSLRPNTITPLGSPSFGVPYNFGQADGAHPTGNVIKGTDGYFYGMTFQGGNNNLGTIFKMSNTGTMTFI